MSSKKEMFENKKKYLKNINTTINYNTHLQIAIDYLKEYSKFIEKFKNLKNTPSTLKKAIQIFKPKDNNIILEFGVATGKTINLIASNYKNNIIYGFDSFEGLQEEWRYHKINDFKQNKLPKVHSNVKLIKGYLFYR